MVEFLGVEEKRGLLLNPLVTSGPPNQSPPNLCHQRFACADRIGGGNATPLEVLSYDSTNLALR